MTVEAIKAIYFKCEKCGKGQYHPYSLLVDWAVNPVVSADNILCNCCGHDNRVEEDVDVIEEL